MTITVIPGRADRRSAASPESITTILSMTHWHRIRHALVVMDSGLAAEPVIGPRFARTRWRRPGMTRGGG
jgi:hypothetical protein